MCAYYWCVTYIPYSQAGRHNAKCFICSSTLWKLSGIVICTQYCIFIFFIFHFFLVFFFLFHFKYLNVSHSTFHISKHHWSNIHPNPNLHANFSNALVWFVWEFKKVLYSMRLYKFFFLVLLELGSGYGWFDIELRENNEYFLFIFRNLNALTQTIMWNLMKEIRNWFSKNIKHKFLCLLSKINDFFIFMFANVV